MSQIEIRGPMAEGYDEILTPDALLFLEDLVNRFGERRIALLEERRQMQARFDAGQRPDFLAETRNIRQGDWTVAPLPEDLLDRRVEITGPPDRKMVINALNSGANVFMADFEDSNSPTWHNTIAGQINLRDAVDGSITYFHPRKKTTYELGDTTATLMVRPRGLHLDEEHLFLNNNPLPASLVDFGLFFFHNAKTLLDNGSGPYFYLPKLERYQEATWWNDVFTHAQRTLDVPLGSIKATVLVETITASFQMDEILHELRQHSAGLNCGRWDYIFSFIKKFRNDPAFLMPDRGEVGMTEPFMRAYTQLVIKTCHRRGVHAMGGMAAQIPIRGDEEANERALEKVRADKLREVTDGHDGTWVAHPGLVALARQTFDAHMSGPNQIERERTDVDVSAADLLAVPTSDKRTLDGLKHNVRVGVQYLAAWLEAVGCVPIYNLMEDAATAEICRTQIWQWRHHGATIAGLGGPLTTENLRRVIDDEVKALDTGGVATDRPAFRQAVELFERLCTEEEFTEFLTLPAYQLLLQRERS